MTTATPTTFPVPGEGPDVEAGLTWLQGSPPPADIFTDRAYVRWLLHELAAAGRWSEVIEVARATQFAMAQGGRWGSWKEILEHALRAARSTSPIDRSTEAWALHQLASRDFMRGDLSGARTSLHQAMQIRESIGETGAAEVSRGNLDLLPLALIGVVTAITALVGGVALLIPAWETPPEPEPLWRLDITEEETTIGDLAGGVELVNRGTRELRGPTVTSSDPDLRATVSGCSTIPPGGADCVLTIELDSDGDLHPPFVLTVDFESAETLLGDTTIFVTG